ncbi:MAG TPA: lysine--tRNA ligase [Thermoplasmatales archaeon]|nr:lysine--tRNA ligase [Thermoplasmatales archaeon]
MHWADVLASQLEEDRKQVIATGITPSGPIHIGNMREVLTADAVYRAAKDKGLDAELIYIADDFDHLRKVYPFLPDSYEQYVGMPLSDIPCPCGKHKSYAEHYLTSFLSSLKELGINPTVYRASQLYKEGKYIEYIHLALERTKDIKGIIEKISKRSLPKNWIPFNMLCEKCHRLTTAKPVLYEYPYVEYTCECGYEGEVDIRKGGVGKLPWRVDWPARWKMLGVTFEPFGKDHAASGSSWDTGKVIAEKIFDYKPPHYVVYEFIQLKGKGAMHSSKGTAVSAEEMLNMTPPEVLRFMIMKNKPSKHIDFDPGLGILDLVDEYDEEERVYFGVEEEKRGMKDLQRTYELSQPYKIPEKLPVQVSYRHLATIVQIAEEWKKIKAILRRTGQIPEMLDKEDEKRLRMRVEHVRYWLKFFAPERVIFRVQKKLPSVELSEEQKKLLMVLKEKFSKIEWKAENIHNTIYEASEQSNVNSKSAFRIMYQLLLGQNHGPRLGYFLSTLERDFVLKRIEEAVK